MIDDGEARRISEQWHGGSGTALYALASTGAIDTARTNHTILIEIGNIKEGMDAEHIDSADIESLWEYVCSIGPRGPVPGWADLT